MLDNIFNILSARPALPVAFAIRQLVQETESGHSVIPWVQIDRAKIPGGGDLRLMRRGTELSIMLGATELMNSRLSGSEEALANLVCERIADRSAPRLLIGGLGMGFTLRAALARLQEDAAIQVAELVPAILQWAKGPMAPLMNGSLEDSRVQVRIADVGEVIGSSSTAFDAILLDVDNGPDGLTRATNDRLYGLAGLAAARRALRDGGILAIWSSARDEGFTRRLGRAGYKVDEIMVRARPGRGAKHVVWIAGKA